MFLMSKNQISMRRTEDGGKWKIGQCSVGPETAIKIKYGISVMILVIALNLMIKNTQLVFHMFLVSPLPP